MPPAAAGAQAARTFVDDSRLHQRLRHALAQPPQRARLRRVCRHGAIQDLLRLQRVLQEGLQLLSVVLRVAAGRLDDHVVAAARLGQWVARAVQLFEA